MSQRRRPQARIAAGPRTIMATRQLAAFAAGLEHAHLPAPVCTRVKALLAIGETVILMAPPVPLVVVSLGINRGCRQNDSLADG